MKKILRLSVLSLLVFAMVGCQNNEDFAATDKVSSDENETALDKGLDEISSITFSAEYQSEEGDVPATEVPKEKYCVYRILSAGGTGCPDGWTKGAEVCVDCPKSERCPVPDGGGPGQYEIVDENGKVICSGKWEREIIFPNTPFCSTCPEGGLKGFEFVD